MPDPLAAYRAEIRAQEDKWFNDQMQADGRISGVSFWDGHTELLAEIQRRHGVSSDDPRVYSIAAYQDEKKEIENEWNALLHARGWENIGTDDPSFHEARVAGTRSNTRAMDCFARHFPGVNVSARRVDSIPKAWAYAGLCFSIAEQVARAVASVEDESSVWNEHIRQIYSILNRIKLPWASRPPYPNFSTQEAKDEFTWIRNKLEVEDAERSKGLPAKQRSANQKQSRQRVRDKLTESRDKWVYQQCCKGVPYDTIALRLPKKNKRWRRITTKQGILACARKYAEDNGHPLPPPRQSQK
jgi:hypothetical protein